MLRYGNKLYLLFYTSCLYSWYELDETIGLLKTTIKNQQSLAWSFTLHELAPQKGLGVQLAIFDTAECQVGFSLYKNCKTVLNLHKEEVLKKNDFCIGKNRNLLNKKKKKNTNLSHAMVSINIIKTIAPNIEISLFPIFDQDGWTDKATFLQALEKATIVQFDLIHLGCKIDVEFNPLENEIDKNINNFLKKFPYIIAPSGNDGPGKGQAYPSKLDCVAFDIGSFDQDHHICSFCQFDYNKGPKFVAPGFNVMMFDKYYSGTSISAAFMTGLISLVLAEFKNDFSYKQILSILYTSSYKLTSDKDWESKVLLGALDIRLALLTMHVLKALKKHIKSKKYEQDFYQHIKKIQWLLRGYEKKSICIAFDDFVKNLHIYAQAEGLGKVLCEILYFFSYINIIKLKGIKKLFDNHEIKLIKDTIEIDTKELLYPLEHDVIIGVLNRYDKVIC